MVQKCLSPIFKVHICNTERFFAKSCKALQLGHGSKNVRGLLRHLKLSVAVAHPPHLSVACSRQILLWSFPVKHSLGGAEACEYLALGRRLYAAVVKANLSDWQWFAAEQCSLGILGVTGILESSVVPI